MDWSTASSMPAPVGSEVDQLLRAAWPTPRRVVFVFSLSELYHLEDLLTSTTLLLEAERRLDVAFYSDNQVLSKKTLDFNIKTLTSNGKQ